MRSGAILTKALDTPDGWVLAFVPLMAQGTAQGVLEVAGPSTSLTRSRSTLTLISNQVGIVVHNLLLQRRLDGELQTMAELVGITSRLASTGSPHAATGAALALFHRWSRLPVAGWLHDEPSGGLAFVAAKGFSDEQRRSLERESNSSPLLDTPMARLRLARAVASAVGSSAPIVAEAGTAFIVAAADQGVDRTSLDLVTRQLGDAIDRLAHVDTDSLDRDAAMGLAVTAHELRGPLLGVKAALERLQESHDVISPAGQAMLARSHSVVGELADMADELLRWSAGRRGGERLVTDVSEVVREAIESCSLQAGDRRIRSRPSPQRALIDRMSIRLAVANLLRNALAHSPSDADISVAVARGGRWVEISVHDDGPGLAPRSADGVFAPFVRGSEAGEGHGLGLFIARRAVEAHGGSLSLAPARSGATFVIRLPALEKGDDQ